MNKNALEVIQKLSDKELKQLIEEYKSSNIPEDALIRKVVLEIFGEINIFVLQMNELLWPILDTVSERMFAYSPHIQKV
jgi:hypothetical protein